MKCWGFILELQHFGQWGNGNVCSLAEVSIPYRAAWSDLCLEAATAVCVYSCDSSGYPVSLKHMACGEG